jgi:hypothetical protein
MPIGYGPTALRQASSLSGGNLCKVNAMSWFYTRAKDWTFLRLPPENTPDKLKNEQLNSDEDYFDVWLRSYRIVDVRRGLRTFFPIVHSFISVPHRIGESREFHTITTPTNLQAIDGKRIDRVFAGSINLLGTTAYRGGKVRTEIGVFSVEEQDLAGPYLKVMEEMAKAAGVSFYELAKPFVQPIRTAMDLLMQATGEDKLEVGYLEEHSPVITGWYVVVRASKGTFKPADLTVDTTDKRLLASGAGIQDYPYILFEIRKLGTHEQWFMIPSVKAAYAELNDAVRRRDDNDITAALEAFEWTCTHSPDLLKKDAQEISNRIKEEVGENRGAAVKTGKAQEAPSLPLLESYQIGQ